MSGLGFLAPGYVIATLTFAIPIAIHLIGRSRARVRRFAAMELLQRSDRRVARRTKLQRWLLLLLRALAIAAVPLILAKPFVEAVSHDLPASAVAGAQSAVLVIDDSLSMSAERNGRTLLATAKYRARRILDALGSDSEVAIVLASRDGGAPVAQLTGDRIKLQRELAQIRPTYCATDITGALKRAAQILVTAARPAHRVYLLSDLAAHGFGSEPPWAAGRGPELVVIDVSDGTPAANRAVVDLRTEPAPHLGPRGVRISVDVANFGAQAVKELPMTLRVDGRAVAKGLVDVPAHGRAVKRFFHVLEPRAGDSELGVYDVTAELAADGLPLDDRRFARVEVRRALRVLVVDGDPRTSRRDDEVFYLETALRPGDRDDSQLDVSTVAADELAGRRLADFDVVFLCNVKQPDGEALRAYVQSGGGLFIALGDNVDPDSYNAALGDLLPQPLQTLRTVGATAADRDDGERRGGGPGDLQRLGRIDRNHPLMAPLGDAHAAEALQAARFSRYALFRPRPEGERQVLMRFADGAPALLEGRLGAGRVLVWASTIDRDWTDLPIQPDFLPLMQQATRYLARAPMHDPEAAQTVGQRHEIPLHEGDLRVEVTQPSGKQLTFEKDKVAGRRLLGFEATDEPGIYRVAAAGRDGVMRARPDASFVVDVDAAESDPTPIDAARLQQLTAGGGAASAQAVPKRRVELWHTLGAALLLLLLGEALLLRRK
ncbi:MAG TPA: BatA domain-containing protein [Polyangia bacterium]|nr:BatA domain-containing protein [Polyangia bacterium]